MSWRFAPIGIAALLAWSAGASSSPPGAFELLAQVRETYASLESYHDLGEVEITIGPAGHERTTLRFFETASTSAGDFFWRSHGETEAGFEERVAWTADEEAFVYSSLYQQYKSLPSLAAELAHALGPGSLDALVVPLLVAGTPDALADPPATVVEGLEPCGKAECWVVSLTRMAGAIESELHIDRQTLLIHEVAVRLPAEQTPLESSAASPRMIRVRHHPSTTAPPAFTPPSGARRVAEWEPRSAEGETTTDDPWSYSAFEDEITVALLTVVTRIVDSRGEPIRGLEPEDLIVRVGQTETPVLSLEWSSSSSRREANTTPRPPSEILETELAEASDLARTGVLETDEPPATPGRLVVFFLQVNLEPSRIAGHLKILPDVERLLRSLHSDDQVAIVSFDSHLKLWQDFSRDRAETFEVLKRAISYGTPLARRSRGVSLLEHFDRRAAENAATPEKALRLTAEALQPLPGEKDLVYLGWGLGRYGAGGVRMTAEYQPTVRALEAARATVFVLDVSQADYHSLEIGLQNVAAHTGGTYDRTLHFASQAVDRLARTIGGHYLVTIDRTAVPEAKGRLTLSLREKDGRVLFKPLTLR